ncbi:MAG: PQQ-binding-like beta-propeller repeat protein [Bacteroidales bacterium]|nr:PQQ-binding-like beta-propeller repeat protein [Bacteroidales bacterium]MDZ4204991.1 PQQ-binding-like beta-propeller repeat protein [Bacteroidales bacterium]
MKTILTILISSFFLATSCSKEETPESQIDSNGVFVSLPFLWKKSLHYGQPVSNSYTNSPIYYNGNIVINTTNSGTNRKLTMINSNNGETIWDWDDRYQPATEYIDISYFHQNNNLLTWQTGKRSYCVNLDNGTTHWKVMRNSYFDVRIQPYQNQDYFTYSTVVNSGGNKEQIAYKGNIQTGLQTEFLRANLSSTFVSPDDYAGGIIYVNKTPTNQNLLLITYYEPLPNWYFNTFYGLYNNETGDWIWERKLLATPQQSSGVNTPPIISGNKVYAAISNSIVCHDLSNGNKLWQKDFNGDFMFSGFIIEDNKIIANCEDTYTYCLNPENGSELWKVQSAGTSSRMSYLNGIVYFAGGSTEKLHAIDINTGKTVWKIDVNKLGEQGGAFKRNGIYVLPALNGKPLRVVALSNINAYCFEAYQ